MNIQQWKHQQCVFHSHIFFFSAFLKSAGYFSLLVRSLVRALNRTWSGASAEHTVCGVDLQLHTLKPNDAPLVDLMKRMCAVENGHSCRTGQWCECESEIGRAHV